MESSIPPDPDWNPTIKVADLTEEVELRSLAQVVETFVDLAVDKKFEEKWEQITEYGKGKIKYFFKSGFYSAMLGVYTVVVKLGLII